jgi:hypothetical protein
VEDGTSGEEAVVVATDVDSFESIKSGTTMVVGSGSVEGLPVSSSDVVEGDGVVDVIIGGWTVVEVAVVTKSANVVALVTILLSDDSEPLDSVVFRSAGGVKGLWVDVDDDEEAEDDEDAEEEEEEDDELLLDDDEADDELELDDDDDELCSYS